MGPTGTGKTRIIISLIAAKFCLFHYRASSVVQLENIRLRWRAGRNKTLSRRVQHYQVTNRLYNIQTPKFFVFAPTNNAVDVLEELLQQAIPVYDESSNYCINFCPIYRRTGPEYDTDYLAGLRQNREDLLPTACFTGFHNGINLCTLGSSYRAFPHRDRPKDWNDRRPYQYIILDEASQESIPMFSKFSTALIFCPDHTRLHSIVLVLWEIHTSYRRTHGPTTTTFLL